jgi:hypothetical protein
MRAVMVVEMGSSNLWHTSNTLSRIERLDADIASLSGG